MNTQFRMDGLLGILMLVVFFVALFYISKAIFFVLSWVAPVLLIAAFFINKSVVVNYVKWIGNLFKTNPLYGIGAAFFTVFGYMIVFPFLFAKALFKNKVKEVAREFEQKREGEYVEYEEISSKPNKEETLELPRLERTKQQQRQQRNDYDEMFD